MGATIWRGRYTHSNDCVMEGCHGHDIEVWYKHRCISVRQNGEELLCLDAGLFDGIVAAMEDENAELKRQLEML